MLRLRNIHPGEVIETEFLRPCGMTRRELARSMDVPLVVVDALLGCKLPVSVDLAIRLARALAMSERFWLGLQMDYDLEEALRRTAGGGGVPPLPRVRLSTDSG